MAASTSTTTSPSALQANPISNSQLQDALWVLERIEGSDQPSLLESQGLSSSSTTLSSAPERPRRMTSTPALEALRARAHRLNPPKSSRLPSRPPSSSRPMSSPASDGRPLVHLASPYDFLRRLSSFRISSYPTSKPRALSPPTMAAYGWTNVQKNRLRCEACGASWVLATPSAGDWASSSGVRLAALGTRMRLDQHRPACPWRSRHCPPSTYRGPRWRSGKDAVEALASSAAELCPVITPNGQESLLRVQHPLPQHALECLSTALQSATPGQPACVVLSDAHILALFGWSVTRPSDGRPPPSYASTPPTSAAPTSVRSKEPGPSLPTLSCVLCHRHVLLTGPPKSFNVLAEHRDHCPYFDPHCGFEDPPPRPLVWEAQLALIQMFVDRQRAKPATLETVAECFRTPGASSADSPQVCLLSFVKAALASS